MSESQNPIPPVPPQGGQPLGYQGSEQPESNPSARTAGMLCHLLSLAGYIVPFGHVIGPLVMWLVKKDEYPFVDDQGKESLNFQITVTIAALICGALMCVVVGAFLLPVVLLLDLIFVIIATVKANQGIRYRYPMCLRFVK